MPHVCPQGRCGCRCVCALSLGGQKGLCAVAPAFPSLPAVSRSLVPFSKVGFIKLSLSRNRLVTVVPTCTCVNGATVLLDPQAQAMAGTLATLALPLNCLLSTFTVLEIVLLTSMCGDMDEPRKCTKWKKPGIV